MTKKPLIRKHMKKLGKPYYLLEVEDFPPYNDFCREIIEPGTDDDFPKGVVGIRLDDDFWCVAALPYDYVGWELKVIVEELWPEKTLWATYHPDSGSLEQKVEQLERHVHRLEKENDAHFSRIRQLYPHRKEIKKDD